MSDHDSEAEIWTEWPACPKCGKRRQTRCPACGEAGTHFGRADDVEAAPRFTTSWTRQREAAAASVAGPVLLICPTCEEHFAPCFYRVCEACGHPFPAGYDISEAPAATERYIATGLLIAVIVFLVVSYLAYMVRV